MPNPENSVYLKLSEIGAVNRSLAVVIIQPGTANDYYFPASLLQTFAECFNGAPCFADHKLGPRSVRDLVGVIEGAHWSGEENAVLARFSPLSSAAWLVKAIAASQAFPRLVGLSADMWVTADQATVTSIRQVNSVDIVIHPAAGGRFIARTHIQEAQTMSPEETTNIVRVTNKLEETSSESVRPTVEAPPAPGGSTEATPPTHGSPSPKDTAALRKHLLEWQLAESRLPAPLADVVRAQAALLPLDADQADALIARLREAWASSQAQTTIRGLGQVGSVRGPLDRLTLSFENLMGLGNTAEHRAAERLTGIREMYDLLTGDWERYGVYRADRVTLANATTSTMANVVANVLNKVLLRAFEARPQWWKPIAYEEDFSTLNDVRWLTVGGFSDLDTVAEGNSYTEKTWDDYAESASFVKKGNYIGITLEMIDRDDVAAVRAIPRRLGHAAHRTLSAAVSALFTANSGTGPALADSEKLFDAAAHGNLGSTALAADAWDGVIKAMYKQTELHSNKRLGVRPKWCLVPIDLEKTALTIFTSDLLPGTPNNDANVRRYSAQVITVPEWTDATDWAAAADPSELEGVCVGYRYGRAPEIFVAQDEQMGSMFTNDEMRVKVRFFYAVGIGDYRALYKQNVAS